MLSFRQLLAQNRNYRYMWAGQVVSEIGDHFNNIAVFSLAIEKTHSGLVVAWVMIARAIPAILAGPLAELDHREDDDDLDQHEDRRNHGHHHRISRWSHR